MITPTASRHDRRCTVPPTLIDAPASHPAEGIAIQAPRRFQTGPKQGAQPGSVLTRRSTRRVGPKQVRIPAHIPRWSPKKLPEWGQNYLSETLTGIDDGDPAVLDTLPTIELPATDGEPDFYTAAVADSGPGWSQLAAAEQQEALDAYRHGADTAITDRVTEHCRATADPTGDSRDLSEPHPQRIAPYPATPPR